MQPACTGANSVYVGEDAYWFVSCGSQKTVLSLCNKNGFFQRVDKSGAVHDPVLDVVSGFAGRDDKAWCSDNVAGCGLSDYGSDINAILPRGLNVVTVSDRTTTDGMGYNVGYEIH